MSAQRSSLAILVALSLSACSRAPGQESDKLLPATTGYALRAEQGAGIEAIQLPTRQKTVVRASVAVNDDDYPDIHALSGPDSKGRIAYVEDHFFVANQKDRRHLLKTIRLDGTQDTTLFSRPGDAMWATTAIGKGQIGSSLALSPIGGRVAFHTDLSPIQMPAAYLYFGSIEIWNIDTKERNKIAVNALNGSLEWFPDGKRLAYVKLVEPKPDAGFVAQDGAFGRKFRNWGKVPAVFVRDVDAGTESFLHVGWAPVVSLDGQFVLVCDSENAWMRVDVTTRKSIKVTWRDSAEASVVAGLEKDVVLVTNTTFKDAPKRPGLLGAFDRPTRILTFGLARQNTDEFQTISSAEYAGAASFGQVGEK